MRGKTSRQAERWEELREVAALVLAQAAGMLAVAVACVGVVYSALEPLVARCGPECARLHAQLGLYMMVAAAAVPLLVLTAVALARRPSPAARRTTWLTARVLAVAALIALAVAEYALLARWLAIPALLSGWLGGAQLPTVITAVAALALAAAYVLAHRLPAGEPRWVG